MNDAPTRTRHHNAMPLCLQIKPKKSVKLFEHKIYGESDINIFLFAFAQTSLCTKRRLCKFRTGYTYIAIVGGADVWIITCVTFTSSLASIFTHTASTHNDCHTLKCDAENGNRFFLLLQWAGRTQHSLTYDGQNRTGIFVRMKSNTLIIRCRRLRHDKFTKNCCALHQMPSFWRIPTNGKIIIGGSSILSITILRVYFLVVFLRVNDSRWHLCQYGNILCWDYQHKYDHNERLVNIEHVLFLVSWPETWFEMALFRTPFKCATIHTPCCVCVNSPQPRHSWFNDTRRSLEYPINKIVSDFIRSISFMDCNQTKFEITEINSIQKLQQSCFTRFCIN